MEGEVCEQTDCRQEQESQLDKIEDTADECWEIRYPNDSRHWILKDALIKKTDLPFASCMRESYVEPKETKPPMGRRRELLQAFLYKELSKQAIENLKKIPPIEPYSSTYNIDYDYGGLEKTPEREAQIEKLKFPFAHMDDKEEIFLRYPLYKSQQNTYWFQNHKAGGITGYTGGSLRNPFRRSSQFTTPVDRQFYEPPEGLH